jgi:hypothetical protein
MDGEAHPKGGNEDESALAPFRISVTRLNQEDRLIAKDALSMGRQRNETKW